MSDKSYVVELRQQIINKGPDSRWSEWRLVLRDDDTDEEFTIGYADQFSSIDSWKDAGDMFVEILKKAVLR